MASVGAINSISSTAPVRQTEVRPRTNAADEKSLKIDAAREISTGQQVSDDQDKKAVDERKELENLAAVSEDGDTVQVSPEGNDKYEFGKFGKVTVADQQKEEAKAAEEKKAEEKKQEAKEAIKESMRESEEKAEQLRDFDLHVSDDRKADKKAREFDDRQDLITQPVSTVGRTETQIKQMYIQGDISKNEYDRAIEIREDRREKIQEKDDAFNKDTGRINEQRNQVEQDAVEIRELYAPDASETIAASTRAEILSNLQDFAINGNFMNDNG